MAGLPELATAMAAGPKGYAPPVPAPAPAPAETGMNPDLKQALAMSLLQMDTKGVNGPLGALSGLAKALGGGYVGHKVSERMKAKKADALKAYRKTGDPSYLYAIDPKMADFYTGRSDSDRDYKQGVTEHTDKQKMDQAKLDQKTINDKRAREIAQQQANVASLREAYGQSGMARRLMKSGQMDAEGIQTIAGTRSKPNMKFVTTKDGRVLQYDTKNPAGYSAQALELGQDAQGNPILNPLALVGDGGEVPASIQRIFFEADALGLTPEEYVYRKGLGADIRNNLGMLSRLPEEAQQVYREILAKSANYLTNQETPSPTLAPPTMAAPPPGFVIRP